MPRFPVAEWLAEQTRLTLFPTPDAVLRPRPREWWQLLADSDPDEVTENPKRGFAALQGEFGGGRLILRTEPARIDWVLAAKDLSGEDAVGGGGDFRTFGPLIGMFAQFASLGEKWLAHDSVPPIGRMAFGASLIHEESSVRSAYQRIPDYVPVQVDPESSDFLFQINLPPVSSTADIEGLKLNRLSKWHVVSRQLLNFAISPDGASVSRGGVPDIVAFRTELDINTVPNFGRVIPQDKLVNLFRELMAGAQAIAENGVAAQ